MSATNWIKVLLLIVLVITLTGCSSSDDSDDIGGGGADFDETLYYTKTQIDEMLGTMEGETDTKLKSYATVLEGWEETRRLQSDVEKLGWVNRADGWDVPSGIIYGVFEIVVENNFGGAVDQKFQPAIGPTEADSSVNTCFVPALATDQRLMIVPISRDTPPDKMYPWLKAQSDASNDSFLIDFKHLFWVRQAGYVAE